MALFVSWKEKTLVQSTLGTQVSLQYLCSVHAFFLILLYLFELIICIILSGEFTMTELAENVKEVSYKPF